MLQQKGRKHMEKIKENQTKKYNLKNDVIFKAFFGKKGNE